MCWAEGQGLQYRGREKDEEEEKEEGVEGVRAGYQADTNPLQFPLQERQRDKSTGAACSLHAPNGKWFGRERREWRERACARGRVGWRPERVREREREARGGGDTPLSSEGERRGKK